MAKFFTNTFAIINIHKKPSVKSELVTQMIYGDSFSVSKKTNKWLKVKIKEDGYKGFIKNIPQSPFNQSTSAPDDDASIVLPAVPIDANSAYCVAV